MGEHLIIIRNFNIIVRNKEYILWLQVGMNQTKVMHDCVEMGISSKSRTTKKNKTN